MSKAFSKDSETFQAIDKYLRNSLGMKLVKLYYVSTYSNNGLTPIVHYDVEVTDRNLSALTSTRFRATVHWNNDVPFNQLPTITQMEVG